MSLLDSLSQISCNGGWRALGLVGKAGWAGNLLVLNSPSADFSSCPVPPPVAPSLKGCREPLAFSPPFNPTVGVSGDPVYLRLAIPRLHTKWQLTTSSRIASYSQRDSVLTRLPEELITLAAVVSWGYSVAIRQVLRDWDRLEMVAKVSTAVITYGGDVGRISDDGVVCITARH